ncbi:MAG: competence type IV pilus assembly protein ComGB [Sporolactobacillus sp.]
MTGRKSWTKKEQAVFLTQLGQCLKEGYPLITALRLQFYQRRPFIREKMQQMIDALEEGVNFHELLRFHHFPSEIVTMIFFSETSGDFPGGLAACGRFLKKQEDNRRRIQRLLRYPIFLAWIFLVMLYIIGHYLLPNFLQLYQSLAIDLPLITRALLFLTGHTMWFIIAGMIVGCGAGVIYFFYRRLPITLKIQIILSIPILRNYWRYVWTQKFAFYFGRMLIVGLSVRQAVDSLSQSEATAFLNYEAARLRQDLVSGCHFTETIARVNYFLPDLSAVVRQGEIGGILGESLSRYSDSVLDSLEEKIEHLLTYVQPAILIIVGALVLGLFSAVLLPIFHIVNGL